MKAKDLAALLLKHPEREVVMSKDSEGNDFSPLAQATDGLYVADTTWSGQLVDPEHGPDDGPPPKKKPKEVFVLWPTN